MRPGRSWRNGIAPAWSASDITRVKTNDAFVNTGLRVIAGAESLARPLYNQSAHDKHSDWTRGGLNAPTERDPEYFRAWQRVSLALQRWLRDQVAGAYFEDLARFENRLAAYPMIVYQASRLCHGRPRTEFTYDLRDYPECHTTLAMSWKLTGRAIQAVLGRIEQRLCEAGMTGLAHRYAPVWHQDVLVAVKKKPKPYVDLLMAEVGGDQRRDRPGDRAERGGGEPVRQDGPSESAKALRDGFAGAGSRGARGSDARAGAGPRGRRRRLPRHWGAPER